MELLANGKKVLQEGGAGLSAEKPDGLKITGKRKHIDRPAERSGIEHFENDGAHHGIEREGQPNRHDCLRAPKLAPDQAEERWAFIRQAIGDQAKAEGEDQPGVDIFQRIHGQQAADALG